MHLRKLLTFFFSKNTCELDIVLTRTVNIFTTNELVKLTTLWTTGPWFPAHQASSKDSILKRKGEHAFFYSCLISEERHKKLKVLIPMTLYPFLFCSIPVSILHKSIAGRYRPVRVADGPITARCRFITNTSWNVMLWYIHIYSSSFIFQTRTCPSILKTRARREGEHWHVTKDMWWKSLTSNACRTISHVQRRSQDFAMDCAHVLK